MIITDPELAQLKPWIVTKLEIISDADSDVLADYVIALVRADDPEPQLRQNVISNLEDFLKDNTESFVNGLFSAIRLKSYMPGYTPVQPINSTSPPFTQPTSPTASVPPNNGAINGINGVSRKRSYNHSMDLGDGRDPNYGRGERQIKQMRRGAGRDSFSGRGGRGNFHTSPNLSGPTPSQSGLHPLPFPPPPHGINLDDPVAMIQAIQAMGLPPLPGLPPFPSSGSGSPPPFPVYGGQGSAMANPPGKHKVDARCRDYDTKGLCTRGTACPFQHGNEMVVPDQEYDPKNAVMTNVQLSPTTPNGLNFPLSDPHAHRGSFRGRGRGGPDRGGFNARRWSRAEFSHAGPNNDRSIKTIVVEQIPEENFTEEAVRAFFSDFGPIEDVSMQAYKRLAIVKFEDNSCAHRAYHSPKVIFDNRFVKVFWYKPVAQTDVPTNGEKALSASAASPATAEQPFDKEKFERDAQAAQKRLEEKNALKKDAEAKRLALEKQKEELLKRQAEEKRKLNEKLAAKGLPASEATNGASPEQTNGTTGSPAVGDDEAKAHTEFLKAKLAGLEAEAKSLGLDYALSDPEPAYRGRGRGGYRGRGSYRGWEGFAGRGGYDPSYRGSPRGRGGFRGRGVAAAAGNYSLDLRPKKVAVKADGEFDEAKDESLRQYLLGLGEYEGIEPSPTSSSTLIVSFKQRFEAENLFYSSKDIPGVGKVEMSWVASAATPSTATPTKQARLDDDVTMEGADENDGSGERTGVTNGANGKATEQDYDVAEEDFDVAE